MSEHYELARVPITAERWEKVYGWDHDKAVSMEGVNTEVRLHHVAADGTRRDLAPDRDGQFEYGYGGSGPHESARAIVSDIQGTKPELSPQDLREAVPEVFDTDEHDAQQVVVYPHDVRMRLGLDPD